MLKFYYNGASSVCFLVCVCMCVLSGLELNNSGQNELKPTRGTPVDHMNILAREVQAKH